MAIRVILSRLRNHNSTNRCRRDLRTHIRLGQSSIALQRHQSTIGKVLSPEEIQDLLTKPTWSVASLIERSPDDPPAEKITQKQLHHLLRLSALPLPENPEQEAKMIETLQSQLHFVKAIQTVDTTGVEPLRAIRDETEDTRKANEYTVESLQDELNKEEVVGFARRIRRKAEKPVMPEEDMVDVLKLAPKKVGRFVVVNTKES